MKSRMRYYFGVLCSLCFFCAVALWPQKAGDEFKLTLSVERGPSNPQDPLLHLLVRLTNTSHHVRGESTCAAFGALYEVVVKRNGEVLPENEPTRKHRQEMENGESKGGICEGSNPMRRLKPGQSYDDDKTVDVSRPGTYEIYVERKSFLRDRSDLSKSTSATVKSDTITYVSPEPKDSLPK
jgi:hypothetical protein